MTTCRQAVEAVGPICIATMICNKNRQAILLIQSKQFMRDFDRQCISYIISYQCYIDVSRLSLSLNFCTLFESFTRYNGPEVVFAARRQNWQQCRFVHASLSDDFTVAGFCTVVQSVSSTLTVILYISFDSKLLHSRIIFKFTQNRAACSSNLR